MRPRKAVNVVRSHNSTRYGCVVVEALVAAEVEVVLWVLGSGFWVVVGIGALTEKIWPGGAATSAYGLCTQ